MSNFTKFKEAVQKQIKNIEGSTLVESSLSKDKIWYVYLNSFPEGTNPIFRERTHHDCNCCKQFIRAIGGMMGIVDNKLVSVWDLQGLPDAYQAVSDSLSKAVKDAGIANLYLHSETTCGTNKTPDMQSDIVWEHFFAHTPSKAVVGKYEIGTKLGHAVSNKSVLERSITEITEESVETVLDLIQQGSLYRGDEHKPTLLLLTQCQNEYKQASDKELYLWEKSSQLGFSSKIKNTVIGTLLEDLSSGVDLEKAVKSFESKVAPSNYKRPKALITEGMIKKAQATISSLGMESSLSRRHASINDITINNVLFADRSAKKDMNVFDDLIQSVPKSAQKFDRVQEVNVETFIKEVLPNITEMEVMLENKFEKNLVTLVSPSDATAPNMLKWDNNFTWSYKGEVADSMDQRVKKAGGNIDAVMRLSLAWEGRDDLDIHVTTPNGSHIYYANRGRILDGGQLDVDANARSIRPEPVENVFWKDEPPLGRYSVTIDNYQLRSGNEGFRLDFLVGEERITLSYNKGLANGSNCKVLSFDYLGNGEYKILSNAVPLDGSKEVKELWNLNSQNFHKVKLMMLSPNHWDDNEEGNKHYFFMLEGCKNPESVRGFYNEFLSNDLNDHRKVFEVLASKMKAPYTEDQLSGLGFSSTKREELIVKVKGSFERVIKIKF